MKLAIVLGVLAACGATPNDDVVGPFTGIVHRYAVDRFALPASNADAVADADDLDGNGTRDNMLGMLIGTLVAMGEVTTHADDMIAAGSLASYVEIEADDLVDDPTVAVRYIGRPGDPQVTLMGGALVGGSFRSNRSATTSAPGEAVIVLPVFADADPLALTLYGMEIDLDADGAGGFDGIVRGGTAVDETRAVGAAGLIQMVDAHPQDHINFANELDADHDGTITAQEVIGSEFFDALVAADVTLFEDGRYAPHPQSVAINDSISAGFRIHLKPCPTGSCASGAPADPCHDRVREGDETDVDCGGSCGACGAGAACVLPRDCQTGACDAGTCRAPSCTDGIRDGFELGIDQGESCG